MRQITLIPAWLVLSLALLLSACQTTPHYPVTDMRAPAVEPGTPERSFWRDSVTYPFPVHYAQGRDGRGVSWEIAYMDEYAGEDRAAAPVLVLVHGKGANAGYWGHTMQRALEAGLRVVAVDLPFYGKSIPGNLNNPRTRSMQDTRDAIHDVIVNQLGITKATYLGHSMGGHWAIGYALTYPQAVDKLILASSGLEELPRTFQLPTGPLPWLDPSFSDDYARWKEVWAPTGRLAKEYATTAEDFRAFAYYKRREGDRLVDAPVGFFKHDSEYARFFVDTRVHMITGPQAEYDAWISAYIRDIYAMGIEVLEDDPNSLIKRLREIEVPTLILFGEDEPFLPVTVVTGHTDLRYEVVRPAFIALSERGAAPLVKFYADAGHFPHTDHPELFAADVVQFVRTGRVSGAENPLAYQAPARALELPEAVVAFLAEDEAAVKAKDVDRIMALYHPGFRSDGRNFAAQRAIYEQYGQALAGKYKVTLTGFEAEGNIARLKGKIDTAFGSADLAGTQLILEDGKWYWYGNRR